MAQTVARLLAASLEAHDVDQVYCVPGESYIGLTATLLERNSIRVIVCRHEAGAGYMAVPTDGCAAGRALPSCREGRDCRTAWWHCIRPITTRRRW
jgi:acetolactate synthase-1/2/3 large subunit